MTVPTVCEQCHRTLCTCPACTPRIDGLCAHCHPTPQAKAGRDYIRPCYVTRADCAGDLKLRDCTGFCERRNVPFCDHHWHQHDAYCKARAEHPAAFESSVRTSAGLPWTPRR